MDGDGGTHPQLQGRRNNLKQRRRCGNQGGRTKQRTVDHRDSLAFVPRQRWGSKGSTPESCKSYLQRPV